MRIAQIAPLAERIPPKKYGGVERVIYTLTEELTKRGHDVTLFASGDSKTSAKLVPVYKTALRDTNMMESHGILYSLLAAGLAYNMQDQFDIIHDHNSHFSLPTANIAKTPTVVTLHGPFNEINRPYFQALSDPVTLVCISKKQAQLAPELGITNVVYNGLSMEHYPFSKIPENYLLFVGRISPEKGVHFAIDVAEALSLPLILAAKLDQEDTFYFKEKIQPRLSKQIQWIGEVDEKKRNKLMSKALCVLHTTNWPEPFGLTLIESMACGCPVVAFNHGSIPEIIVHGKTGFVVPKENIDAMVSSVLAIGSIDRSLCRAHALTHFSGVKMTNGYEKIYNSIVKERKRRIKTKNRAVFPYFH